MCSKVRHSAQEFLAQWWYWPVSNTHRAIILLNPGCGIRLLGVISICYISITSLSFQYKEMLASGVAGDEHLMKTFQVYLDLCEGKSKGRCWSYCQKKLISWVLTWLLHMEAIWPPRPVFSWRRGILRLFPECSFFLQNYKKNEQDGLKTWLWPPDLILSTRSISGNTPAFSCVLHM